MKKLILGLVLVVLLLVAVVAFAVMNLNTYLNENRDTLAGLASDAAGREVSFESAQVAFKDGLAVRLGGLRVAEDPQFGKSDFLSLEEAFVGVRLMPALQRRIEVSGIRLDGPEIRVIQTAKGFNFSTLGGQAEGAADAPARDPEQGAAFAVAIAALEINDGTIEYEDRSTRDGLRLVIQDFETSGTDLALEGPIGLDFSGRVHSTKSEDAGLESRLEGEVAVAGIDSLVGTVHLTSPKLHPAIFGVRLEEAGEGNAPERLDDLVVDVQLTENPDKQGYPVKVRSSDARLSGFDLAGVIVDIVYRSTSRGSEVKLDRVFSEIAGGDIELSGDVVLGTPGNSPFDLDTKLRTLDSGTLANVLLDMPEGYITGQLGGDAALRGDSLDWETLKRSLAGQLTLDIGEGALEEVNILDTLVGRLTSDPGLGMLAANSIRDVAAGALDGDRTPFKAVNMALEMSDGAIHARDISLSAGDFALNLAGTLGIDGALSANGTIDFSDDLSRKILAQADRLGPLLGEGNTVSLPVRIGGTASSPRLSPDLSALTAKARTEATAEVKNRAVQEIGDALFGKKREGDEVDPEKDAQRNATEGLIKEGLGRILGR